MVGFLSVLIHYAVLYVGTLVGVNQAERHIDYYYVLNFFCSYEIGITVIIYLNIFIAVRFLCEL